MLYKDEEGRKFALSTHDLDGTPATADALPRGHAYVLFPPRRGLRYDTTEDELGACATPKEGTIVDVQRIKGKNKINDECPSDLTLRITGVYRYNMRLSAMISFVVVG